jgi:hypothetical protein
VLRVAQEGEATNWPALPGSIDPDVQALLAISGKSGVETRVLSPIDATEPFKVTLKNGDQVTWRYARVKDLVAAEEYINSLPGNGGPNAAFTGSHSGKFNNFLTALHVVSINGKPVQPPEALMWVKRSPTWLLDGLRQDILDRSFGFETEPKLRCKRCGGSWKVELPSDGGIFRPART